MDALATGISGLDVLMKGGLRPRRMHFVFGESGTGKTMLSQQIAFHHASQGRRVLFITILGETVESLIANAQGQSFFNPDVVAQGLYYVSLFSELLTSGVNGVLDEIRRLVREHRVEILAFDGMRSLKEFVANQAEYQQFVFNLVNQLGSLGVTSLFLSGAESITMAEPEASVADGIIQLSHCRVDGQVNRHIEIVKLRNARHLMGQHSFIIRDNGLTVFPRLEALTASEGLPPQVASGNQRASLGIEGLDQITNGGLPAASVTVFVGDPGTGKTMAALSFLAEGAKHGERGVYLGSHDAPARLVSKASGIGRDLSHWLDEGILEIIWEPLLEPLPDELAWRLIDRVKEMGANRVVVDGLDDLLRIASSARTRPYADALLNVLKGLGVTTLVTAIPQWAAETQVVLPTETISGAVDNIILLRYAEVSDRLRRLLGILKMRESEYDSTLYEFTISRRGLELGKPFNISAVRQQQCIQTWGRRG